MFEIKGLPGAGGCAAGQAVICQTATPRCERLPVDDLRAELALLSEARQRYSNALRVLSENARSGQGEESAAIFAAYWEIVQDDVFFGGVAELIRAERVCACWALEQKRTETEALFSALDDPYLSARMADINNVCTELTAELQGCTCADPFAGAEGDRLIVFAGDLSPADTVRMDPKRLAGIVTERGGITSHTVILAKALGIPAVVGVGPLPACLRAGEEVLLNGSAGTVLLDADAEARTAFLANQAEADRRQRRFDACLTAPAVTLDGRRVRVNVNSGDRESIRTFDSTHCDGVGLFRTEFLYMEQSDYPDEELQFSTYRHMAQSMAGKELIIRTLDIGGDKQLSYMDLPREENPFLGYRAIRLCLDRTEVFKTQLRAILRAGIYGNVKIMFPMIVNLEELLRAKVLLSQAMDELDARGLPYRRDMPVGIMIETPAAVLLADRLAGEVSFFSIGSNDLLQYLTATDRQNERVQYLYDPCNISFLRAVRMTCDAAHARGVEVGICGETASEPRLVPLWAAMGIDELSVAPALVGRTRYILSRCSATALRPTLEDLLSGGSIAAVKARLDALLADMGV